MIYLIPENKDKPIKVCYENSRMTIDYNNDEIIVRQKVKLLSIEENNENYIFIFDNGTVGEISKDTLKLGILDIF